MESKKESFKNRRQKALRPVAVKLAEIQDKKPGISHRRVILIVATAGVLLLGGASYLLLVNTRTQELRNTMQATKQHIKTSTNTFTVAYKKAALTERPQRIIAYAESYKTVDCGMHYFFSPLVEQVNVCMEYNSSVKAFQAKLRDISSVVAYDIKLKKVLTTAVGIDNGDATDWRKNQDAWAVARLAIGKLTPPQELKESQKQLQVKLQSLVGAWQTVRKADAAQKLTDYTASKKKLAQQYEALRKYNEAYKKTYNSLQAEAFGVYKKLYE